ERVTGVDLGIPRVPTAPMSPNRPRPDTPALVDSFGRTATDLRVSVTDKCNLRCTYCMPAEGLEWMPDQRLLTDDEIVRLIDIAVRLLGVTDVRLTGGEPLLRPRLEGLVARIAALRPRPRLAMTTNGIGFAKRARAFADAGLGLRPPQPRAAPPARAAGRPRRPHRRPPPGGARRPPRVRRPVGRAGPGVRTSRG